MARRGKLAGELLAAMIAGAREPDAQAGAQGSPDPLPPRARNGGTDPQSLAELLAYEIPFRTEPAISVVFPPETATEPGRERRDAE